MANDPTNERDTGKQAQAEEALKQGARRAGPARRGFAGMDPARQREIASLGGRAAHASGNAHQFTSEEAREAGRKSHRKSAASSGGGAGASAGAASS
ncbi:MULTISPECIES: KGG domain-containing protein [Paracidovorax]|uniref:Stress-induced acidophilic repeat motif-containing protein n=1 Tax=Paracidovorax cattleyae TaxID=80868 RepID=A0A1H0NSQ7_9BURK|nr:MULTISPECIES: KGG domain-containing protein [Paracidovorax]AVS71400.1 stress-induced protein [Paracidovorax avenae]AVS75102.1 stress-induced protein [Paracidovorax cattleyae]AVS82011.1 stress-induced protein [Paracidovorax avenae]AVS94127.1 stress-induced protein [Paracidovorax avenae]AVS99705.1 stress-induced protein [Paracidovorax avenae]